MKAAKKAQEALEYAKKLRAKADNWTEVHNGLYGIGGKLGELFTTQAERVAFGKSSEAREIAKLIDELRDEAGDPASLVEDLASVNGSVSVRMPRSIHAALLAEAKDEGVSLNQLCVTKLAVQLRPLCAAK